jgi:hypothetical protein
MNDERNQDEVVKPSTKHDVPASDHKIKPPVVKAPAPEPVDVKALAATVRTALKNGHPDATKHLDALLTELGA